VPAVTLAVEGPSDVAVLRRLCETAGVDIANVYVCGGKLPLDERLKGFNQAAQYSNWVVLRDLNADGPCASQVMTDLLPDRATRMFLRLAVRAVEAWLLADRKGLASYLGIKVASIPSSPDLLRRPKRALVDVARHSKRRELRRDLVPEAGLSTEVGPGYTARITEFAQRYWSPTAGASNSGSLARCMAALRRIR